MLAGTRPEPRASPWGIGMRATSFVSARLMETWAHGLDVRAALGAAPHDTDRLAHVAWLATRALPYAYTVAGREPPPGALRVELTLPSGATWAYGPTTPRTASRAPRASTAGCSCSGCARAEAVDLRAVGDAAVEALIGRPRRDPRAPDL